MKHALLEIDGLSVDLLGRQRGDGLRRVIHDVSLTVASGESVGLVGESGSGKSMTTKAVMGLLPRGARANGALRYHGQDISGYNRKELSAYRAKQIAMIYQDPRAHTNPLVKIGDFLIEGVVAAKLMSRADARERAHDLLQSVGITDAGRRMVQYPHELSGGLLQRVMIVMALMSSPSLILADEPTTALDVTVQSEVVAILAEQIRDRSLGMLFITHDLDLAAAISDSLAVMYAGAIVENGSVKAIYDSPRHPYTAGLLASRPSLHEVKRLQAIPGRPLSAFEVAGGCAFASRCPLASQRCLDERPVMREVDGREVACHHPQNVELPTRRPA